MNQVYRLRRHFLLAIALVTFGLGHAVVQATPVTWQLLPGSTITPITGFITNPTPIGPTEALTGTFQWPNEANSNHSFDAIALFFSSPSFSITLNQSENDMETFVSPNSSLTNFAEIIDLTGLNIDLGELIGSGTYSGSPSSPTFLSYPVLFIIERGPGGLPAAQLSFSASPVAVPEPPGWILLATALALAIGLGTARKSSP